MVLFSKIFYIGVNIVLLIHSVSSQTFLRRCDDRGILSHPEDTYCSHICSKPAPQDIPNAYCDTITGNCICTSTCIKGVETKAITLDRTVCPTPARNPVDPIPNRLEDCNSSCLSICGSGGIGTICGENQFFLSPDIYATICTCSCSGCPRNVHHKPIYKEPKKPTYILIWKYILGKKIYIFLKFYKFISYCVTFSILLSAIALLCATITYYALYLPAAVANIDTADENFEFLL